MPAKVKKVKKVEEVEKAEEVNEVEFLLFLETKYTTTVLRPAFPTTIRLKPYQICVGAKLYNVIFGSGGSRFLELEVTIKEITMGTFGGLGTVIVTKPKLTR